jgi:hypothetical protein
MTVIIFGLSFIVMNFPSIWLLEQGKSAGYGVYWALKICSIVFIVAAWGRYFGLKWTEDIRVVICFQALAGCCLAFVQNMFSKIAAIWFSDKERTTAASIGAIAFSFGAGIGIFLGPMFVEDSDIDPANWE